MNGQKSAMGMDLGMPGKWVRKVSESEDVEKAFRFSDFNPGSKVALCSASSLSLPKSREKEDHHKSVWRKYAGILLTLSASLVFSAGVLIAKILSGPEYGFHSYSSTFWRFLGVTVPAVPLLLFYECGAGRNDNPSVFTPVWPLNRRDKWWTVFGLLMRGLLGGTSVILRYYSLQYLTIADTSVITYSTPVLVTVLAHFFLKEKCGVVSILVAIITFGGVFLITRPPFLTGGKSFNTDTLIGTGFACGSLLCASLIVIITRKIRDVHFALMTFVFGFLGMAQAYICTLAFQDFQYPTGLEDTAFVLALAVLSFFGQVAIILALQFEQAGPVSLLRACDVIFGFLLQFVFLGVAPDLLGTIGGVIVLTCVGVTGMRKWISLLPVDDANRRRFGFLLI